MDNEQIPFLQNAHLSCDDVEELMDCYIDGEMVEVLKLRYEAHLAGCSACRGLIADCRHLVQTAKSLADSPIPPEVSQRLRNALAKQVGYKVTPLRPRLTLIKS